MDLRAYFQKIRSIEATISSDPVVVVSLETPDGGKAGVFNQVSRSNAAELIAANRARLASEGEEADYLAECEERWRLERDRAMTSQVRLLTGEDLRTLRDSLKER